MSSGPSTLATADSGPPEPPPHPTASTKNISGTSRTRCKAPSYAPRRRRLTGPDAPDVRPWDAGAQPSPNASVSTNGPAPTGTVRATAFVAGSMTVTSLLVRFGIQTRPSGPTVPSTGPVPARMVATTVFVAGSTRTTLFPGVSATQTALSVAANQAAPSVPSSSLVTVFVAGSMRCTRGPFATQTEPAANDRPAGEPPTRILATTRFRAGLIRETVPSP